MGKSSNRKRSRSYENEENRLIRKLRKLQEKKMRERSPNVFSTPGDNEIINVVTENENEPQGK